MKRIIPFSKYFLPAAVISALLCIAGIVAFLFMGFNLGVDFQAGLIQEIQFAPTAMRLTYNGRGNATVSLTRTGLIIVISGAGIDEVTYNFPYANYRTMGDLLRGFADISGLNADLLAARDANSSWLIQSTQSDPQLGSNPYVLHYLAPGTRQIHIDEVRSSLLPLGPVSVQVLGEIDERRFMIRMEDDKLAEVSAAAGDRRAPGEIIISTLESVFGRGGVAVSRSDYVQARFARNLTDQAGILISLTLLLILAYCAIRFKTQFAIGAVLAIVHDSLLTVAFVIWTRMEFNTITIAAVLTIFGYSLNDKIVIFDRMRETRTIYPDATFKDILNRAISECLGRTIITTSTTMLAVSSLYIFTTGSMKDFALLLMVGFLISIYSTIFIASGFVYFWEIRKLMKDRKKLEGDIQSRSGASKLAKT